MRSLIFQTVVRVVHPVLLLFAAILFLKGHNSPGGGFIAGLLAGVAIVLRYVAFRRFESQRYESNSTLPFLAVGLAVALASAAAPLFFGHSFFTHTFGFVHIPVLGEIELASASIFDFGVAIVVIANVATVISALTEEN